MPSVFSSKLTTVSRPFSATHDGGVRPPETSETGSISLVANSSLVVWVDSACRNQQLNYPSVTVFYRAEERRLYTPRVGINLVCRELSRRSDTTFVGYMSQDHPDTFCVSYT